MEIGQQEYEWKSALKTFTERWDASSGDEFLGDNPFKHFVFGAAAMDWSEFVDWHDSLAGKWAFRGQRSAEWNLHSSLDRAVQVSGRGENFSFTTHVDRRVTENRFLFRFKQQAHRHLRHLPDDRDLVSWLALMQHHGVPTRLLDWTRSPYVAAYFACELAIESRPFAIWAIDLEWLNDRTNLLLQMVGERGLAEGAGSRADRVNEILGVLDPDDSSPMNALLLEVDPARNDEWMAGQQGLFLCKTYSRAMFNQCLMRMMIKPELIDRPVVRKLDVSASLRVDFLRRLRRMNIHRGSLFPDLDGFSQSLRMDWEIDREELRLEMERPVLPPTDELEVQTNSGLE